MRTIVHFSDIHFGKFDPSCTEPLLKEIQKISPDLIVISGDLTQRARVKEFLAARDFLKKLEKPYLVIPGNHDIRPLYSPISRIIDPYDRYKKYISETLDPVYADDEIALATIRTVRSSAIKDGRVNKRQVERARNFLEGFEEDRTKIIVTHHPFDLPMKFPDRKLARKAKLAVSELSEVGTDLFMAGHYHTSSTSHTAIRYKINGYAAVAVQAGTVSMRQRGQTQTFNVITVNRPHIIVDTYFWVPGEKKFHKFETKKFSQTKTGWVHNDQNQ